MNQQLIPRSEIVRAILEELADFLGLILHPLLTQAIIYETHEKILIGGVRAGKSVAIALCILIFVFMRRAAVKDGKHESATLIWLVAPNYSLGHEEINYLADWSLRLGWQKAVYRPSNDRWLLELDCGISIVTRSAQHPETLASVAPDFIAGCEPGQFPEEVHRQLELRAMEKNAPIVYGGTAEDDINQNRFTWFIDMASAWKAEPGPEQAAFSLPSWVNLYLYGDCRKDIAKAPELGVWCPDANHPHAGREHPIIRREEFGPGRNQYVFLRKIAAEPAGVQYQVYPEITEFREDLLRQMSPEELSRPVLAVCGGVDYGTVHPSAIVVVQLIADPRDQQLSFNAAQGQAWVRECWFSDTDPGDYDNLNRARQVLAQRYHCHQWVTDPNERYMARSWQAEQVSYAEGARSARTGLVSTRLRTNKLFFDAQGPGVVDLVREAQQVHYRKDRMGGLALVRERDDRTAAMENAIHGLDQYGNLTRPAPLKRKYAAPRLRGPEFVQV